MHTVRRHCGGGELIVCLVLGLSLGKAALAAPPPAASPALLGLIGEYRSRSGSQTLTLYESGNRLYVSTAGTPPAEMHRTGQASYSTDDNTPARFASDAAMERCDLHAF